MAEPFSHRSPENPSGQLQLNPLTRSMQVPLLRQGLLSHSLMSVKKRYMLLSRELVAAMATIFQRHTFFLDYKQSCVKIGNEARKNIPA